MKLWITAALCCMTIATASTSVSTAVAQSPSQVYRYSVSGKRAWIYDRIVNEVYDPYQRSSMIASLNRMSEFQLDQAISNYFANRNGRGRVAYQPVITTLPTGASLNAGAVISPDRRHVRINAQPFFSQVGPVRTFNTRTGQTRVYPGPNSPQSGYLNPVGTRTQTGRRQYDPRNPSHVETYHDGLRTRIRQR